MGVGGKKGCFLRTQQNTNEHNGCLLLEIARHFSKSESLFCFDQSAARDFFAVRLCVNFCISAVSVLQFGVAVVTAYLEFPPPRSFGVNILILLGHPNEFSLIYI